MTFGSTFKALKPDYFAFTLLLADELFIIKVRVFQTKIDEIFTVDLMLTT